MKATIIVGLVVTTGMAITGYVEYSQIGEGLAMAIICSIVLNIGFGVGVWIINR
jgi:hypothetical protein